MVCAGVLVFFEARNSESLCVSIAGGSPSASVRTRRLFAVTAAAAAPPKEVMPRDGNITPGGKLRFCLIHCFSLVPSF